MNPVDKLIQRLGEYDLNLGKSELRKMMYETREEVNAQKRRMFLEGFKNSAEGFNGEHPPRTDSEMWESIRDDYFKINDKLFGE